MQAEDRCDPASGGTPGTPPGEEKDPQQVEHLCPAEDGQQAEEPATNSKSGTPSRKVKAGGYTDFGGDRHAWAVAQAIDRFTAVGHCIGEQGKGWICTTCLVRFHRTTLPQASKAESPCKPVVQHLPGPLTKPQRQVGTAPLRVGDQEASSSHKLSHFRGTTWCSQRGAYSSIEAPFKLLGKVCQGPANGIFCPKA